ncbi:UNVERIFIED_CONTAM: hypothetical protein GTU68_064906 [Idotea baltica]|nr:hypothetical protein [Idotea baltica]
MDIALKQAEQAYEENEVPVGAVIVFNSEIIAKAYNQTERLNDITAHAEMLAITAAANYIGGKYLHQCTMYVTLEPCPMCAGALSWAQLGRIVWGATDEKRGSSVYNPQLLHKKTLITTGVKEQECSFLLKEFFKNKRSDN